MAAIGAIHSRRPAAALAAAGRVLNRTLFYGILAGGAFLSLAPFVWLLSISFRPVQETYTIPMSLLPHTLTLENVAVVLARFTRATSLPLLYRNSLVVTGTTVFQVVVFTALAGFAFARLRFPGREALFWVVTLGMFMPITTALPALYQLFSRLDLIDTLPALILPYTGWQMALGNFVMRSAFASIPKDMEDAATIDGAGTRQLFTDIMLPLVSSSLVTVAILTFVPVWGEYLLAFTLTSTTQAMPISVGIRLLSPGPSTADWTFPVAATAAILTFIPPILIYFGLQKWFTKGLMEGALKF